MEDSNSNRQTMMYEGPLLVGVTDAVGRKVTLEYDNNELYSIIDPSGIKTCFSYENGKLNYIWYENENVHCTYGYNQNNLLTSAMNIDGAEECYYYLQNETNKVSRVLEIGVGGLIGKEEKFDYRNTSTSISSIPAVFDNNYPQNVSILDVNSPDNLGEVRAIRLDAGSSNCYISSVIGLKANVDYTVSFDYWSDSDNASFVIGVDNNNISQVNLSAGKALLHYEWNFKLGYSYQDNTRLKVLCSNNMTNIYLANFKISEKGKIEPIDVTAYQGSSNAICTYTNNPISNTRIAAIRLNGGVSSPMIKLKGCTLKKNTEYTVEFDYWADADNVAFEADLYPDNLPQSTFVANKVLNHAKWNLSSSYPAMEYASLRFFNDIVKPNPSNIYIANIKLYETNITDINSTIAQGIVSENTTIQFDALGRTVSAKNQDGDAQYYKYNSAIADGANRIQMESSLQKSTINYLKNHNLEVNTNWNFSNDDNSTGGGQFSTTDKYIGNQSLMVNKTNTNSRNYFEQSLTLQKGKTYTFSGYIKTNGVSNSKGKGAHLLVHYKNNQGVWLENTSSFISGSTDWGRNQVTFTIPSDASSGDVIVRVAIADEIGTAYFDCLQLEDGIVANRYNLVENSDFRFGTTLPDYWTVNNNLESTDKLTKLYGNGERPIAFDKTVFSMHGKIDIDKTLGQKIQVSGTKGTPFVLSGWACGNSVPLLSDEEGRFSINLKILKNDGSIQKKSINFNYATNEWQYISDQIIADGDFNGIIIEADYSKNCNYFIVDDMQVYIEEFGQSYTYDKDGNIKSTVDIAKQSSTFDYLNNNLTKLITPTGSSFEYTFDKNKNVKSGITSEGLRSQFTYDNFGNPTSVILQADAQSTSVSNGNAYYIRNKNSGKYLDSDQGIYNGKNVIQTPLKKSPSQMWNVISTDDGCIKLVPLNAPEYTLDVVGAITNDGTNIQLCNNNGSDAQKFKIQKNSSEDGGYAILTKITNFSSSVEVSNFEVSDGANVQQWKYGENGITASQVWYFEAVPQEERILELENPAIDLMNKPVYIYNRNSNKVVQVVNNIDQNGTPINQYENGYVSGMKWYATDAGGGYVYLKSLCSSNGKVLGFSNTNSLSEAQLRNNDGSDLVKFKIIKHTNGSFEIQNKASGLSLAVLDGSKDYGGKIIQKAYNNSGVEREWYFQSSNFSFTDGPWNDFNYYIKSKLNSQFFDIPVNEDKIGTALTQNTFVGFDNQKIKLISCGNGYFQLQPLSSTDGKVIELDVDSGNLKLNTKNTSSAAQQFKFIYYKDTYKIVNRELGDNYVIQVPGASYENGESLDMAYNSGVPAQNQQWLLERIDKMITSSATYTSNGNYLASTTDSSGNTTYYNNDANKGILKSITNANDVTINYNYDSNNNNLTSVSQTGVTVNYAYDKDKLSSIITENGNLYSFGYNNINQNTSIKVGVQSLVTNTIDNRKGLLTQSEYGNGATFSPMYDMLDRVIAMKFNGQIKANYYYDNDGKIVKATDGFTNTTTKYTYDLTKRLVLSTLSNGQSIKNDYDNKNRISAYTNSFSGISTKTTFDYSKTSLINGVNSTQGNLTLSQKYNYDSIGRVVSKNFRINNDAQYYLDYSYLDGANSGTTTNLISAIDYSDGCLQYEYDKLGNITKIYQNDELKVTYTYDDLNQLKTETRNGSTIIYNYDKGGNITSKITSSASGSSTIDYEYGDQNWKDLLTSYQGESITYDEIGNPLKYGYNYDFTWQNGRRLTTMMHDDKTILYTYNVDGLRTKKLVNNGDDIVTTNYYLNGSNIVTQTSGSNRFDFLYDNKGNLYGFTYNNYLFTYLRNAQNDIIGIIDDGGNLCVNYEYDAWGKLLSLSDDTSMGIGKLNPFRYRGYYYDVESGFYYLNSRYYDPNVGRFINADGLVSTGENILGHNMFLYCNNNSVNLKDPSGCFAIIGDQCIEIESGDTLWSIAEELSGNGINWTDIGYEGDPSGLQIGEIINLSRVYDLGNGWSYRRDKENSDTREKEHIHVGDGSQEYQQDIDGGRRTKQNPKGLPDPPSKIKDKLKDKAGWDWDANKGKVNNNSITDAALIGGAGIGLGYLAYRGARMLPSLFPALWWTIPENLIWP